MDLVQTIIGLISGAVGGNVAGAATKDKGMGVVGNSLLGLLGGGAGNMVMQLLGLLKHGVTADGGFSMSSLLGNIGGSGVTGALLALVASLIKGAANKPK